MGSNLVIRIEGVEELQKMLKRNVTLNDVKQVVRQNGSELNRKMARNASFSKGYQTGQTKRSIKLTLADGGMTAMVGPGTSYSPYLEYGTRFMSAQPFIRPAFNDQRDIFIKDMQKLMKRKLR